MKQMITGMSVLLCLAGVLIAGGARADIPRTDNRCPAAGAACDNAGFSGEEKGVCRETQDPQCGAGGGTSVLSCPVCEVPDAAGGAAGSAGAGDAAGSAGAGGDTVETAGARNTAGAPNAAGAPNHAGAANGAAGDAGSTDSAGKKDDSGCSVRAVGSERGVATLLLGLGLAALAVSRRRR